MVLHRTVLESHYAGPHANVDAGQAPAAQLDIARAEAKEQKRQYRYPRKRNPLRPDNE